MTDEEIVLVSDGFHASRFHRPLAGTGVSACGRYDLSSDTETIPRDEAEDEGYSPCKLCSFPERTERELVADGGER